MADRSFGGLLKQPDKQESTKKVLRRMMQAWLLGNSKALWQASATYTLSMLKERRGCPPMVQALTAQRAPVFAQLVTCPADFGGYYERAATVGVPVAQFGDSTGEVTL